MTEQSTSDFMPQWQYDHSQDREYMQEEAAIQWRGMNRVAEQVRRREEHYLEVDFDAMDFEARAAALEAHFFGVRRRSPPPERAVPTTRPQSASLVRRIPDSDPSIASNFDVHRKQRPQSAKNRSDISQASDGVDWSTSAESKASKWREMLVRGPEFKQLTLRQLEIETYELLYSTLEHTNVQPSARRRKRKQKASDATRPTSKELACGSGLHLARSRKKRQQEHDRELMLGKTRQLSRRSERERANSEVEGKQAIQDKTRRRRKQLQTKTSRTQLQEHQCIQVPTQDKRTGETCIQRPSSANRVRGPWVPSGSARSVAIRGISPTSEVTQDKRIEQMLEEVFQRQMHAHLSASKKVQTQLKKAQQRVKSCRLGESRTSKILNKSGRPTSAPRTAANRTDEVKVSLQSLKGNQENDRIRVANFHESTLSAPVLVDLQLSSCEIEELIGESPATPKLVIPPLRFPPNLWKYQLTDDSQDGMPELPQENSLHLPSNSVGAGDDTLPVKATSGDKIEGKSPSSCHMANTEHVDEMETQVEMPTSDQDRKTTVEDLYLAEDHDEQTSPGFSSGGNETLPSELGPGSQLLPKVIADDDKCTNIELLSTLRVVEGVLVSSRLDEERIFTEISTLSAKADSPLQEATGSAIGSSVEDDLFARKLGSSSRAQESVVTPEETANIAFSCPEQQLSVDHSIYEKHCSNMSMIDKEGGDIDSDVILGGDRLQQNDYDRLPLVGQCGSGEYEQHGDACQEHHDVTRLTLASSTPMEDESCSVFPVPPELESSHTSPDYQETITSAVNSDTPLEMQVPICPDDELDMDPSTTIQVSKLPQSNPTFIIETGALNSSSESNEAGETEQLRMNEAVKNADCEENIVDTFQLENTDHCRTSRGEGEQQVDEPGDIELSQQLTLEPIVRICTPPGNRSARESESKREQAPTLAEDKVEEDPLRLHQQEVTRSFLKRISSRTCTVVDPELATSQPTPCKEQVEDDDTLGSIEKTDGVMGIESQVEQLVKVVKEQEHIHGCILEIETTQALEDHESTIEKYPPATVSLATTAPTEKVDAAESFTSADGDSTVTDLAPSSTNIELPWEQAPDPNNVTNYAKETVSHLASSNATEVDGRNRTQPSLEYHNAARNIQAQYRCFVRRRLILDQLHFVVANQRRQARRKSRQKERKTKSVDMVTSIPVASSMDSLPEEVQPVALTTKGFEVTPELPLMEEPRPSVEDAGFRDRKGSYDYAFDLFDGLYEESEEVKLDVLSRTAEGSNDIRPEKLEQRLEHPTILPEKDVDNTTISFELLQGGETHALAPSDTIEVKPNRGEPRASASTSLLSSTTHVDLAVIEENPAPKYVKSTHVEAVPEPAEVNSRWERYVDSTTSKSYYFNPSTNETRWTAPAGEDRGIISSRATPTTPHSTAGTAPDAAVTRQSKLWQEFLDEASGQLYYYNTKTGECSWELPASDSPGVVESLQSSATAESEAIGASPWIMYIDPASQAPYYVNVETLATSWEKPDDFVVAELNANRETYVIAVDDHAALEI